MQTDRAQAHPLRDRKIFVACSEKKMSALVEGLRASGATVLPFPIIEIRGIEDKRPLDQALGSLHKYAWIIFTSAHGVLYFSKRFHERALDKDLLSDTKICAIGPATAKTLRENGFRIDLIPELFIAEGVLEALGRYCGGLKTLAGRNILIPRAKEARNELPEALLKAGAHVDIVVCYQTVRAEMSQEDIAAFTAETPDMVVFTSSSTVKFTMEILGPGSGKKLLQKSTVAAIGPVTADTVESFGKHVEIVPKESTIVSLIHSIEEYYNRQQTERR